MGGIRRSLSHNYANSLWVVVEDFIISKQKYAVKGKSIQNKQHLVAEIIEGIEDDTDVTLISLHQSKALDKVEHRLLVAVLETGGFEPEFCKWINVLYQKLQAVLQVNAKRLESFAIELSIQQGCLFSIPLFSSPRSRNLGKRGKFRPCSEFPLSVVTGQR